MSGLSAKFGFIIEADTPGYFYNRIGHWVEYKTAAEGYVWSEDEAVAIQSISTDWSIKPRLVHPAVYDDTVGVTIVTGSPAPIASLTGISTLASTPGAVKVPDGGGAKFDLSIVTAKLGVNRVGSAMHSL